MTQRQPAPARLSNLPKRFVAEVIGTFFLVVAALLSPAGLTFALVGLTLLVMVLVLGKVSGSHLNPAVTVGLVVARQFPFRAGLLYILAQVIGAFLAFAFGSLVGRQLPTTDPHANALWFEVIGTVLLVFVVTRVVMSKLPPAASGLGIGLALSVGIAIAGPSSGGVLNPAIALVLLLGKLSSGSLLTGILYLIVPILAGAVAALLAVYLTPDEIPEEEREEVTAKPERR
ncbi:aquaporin [Deinococcus arenicola]|uniref:Aquaporin n=1 Tax=Deinococcus arenicola TaxID=2994950 RepID=A0ABU4DV45_9DEIO|nr:aquaporin [Deinococcus sp. ZS9-10]MDV6376313.1 aquaporin [Deinococcus sp. ZS9-10]